MDVLARALEAPPAITPTPTRRRHGGTRSMSPPIRRCSDIVFVQLPHAGLQDRSGGWLDSHVLDALRYILGCKQKKTQQAVVTLSYGSTVGPHDGSSILSGAIAALKKAHGRFVRCRDGGRQQLRQPRPRADGLAMTTGACAGGCFPAAKRRASCRRGCPKGRKVRIRVAPPGHKLDAMAWLAVDAVATWPAPQGPVATSSISADSSRGDGAMALIAIAPTETGEGSGGGSPRRRAARRVADRVQGGSGARRGPRLHRPQRPGAQLAAARAAVVFPGRRRRRSLPALADRRRRRGQRRRPAPVRRREPPRRLGARSAERSTASRPARPRSSSPGISATSRPIAATVPTRGTRRRANRRARVRARAAGARRRRCRPTSRRSFPGIRAAGSRSGVTFRLIGTSVGAPQHAPNPVARGGEHAASSAAAAASEARIARSLAAAASSATASAPLDPDLDGAG